MNDITIQDTITSKEICAVMGIAHPTLMTYVKQGRFPQPLPLPFRKKQWSKSEVTEYINSLYSSKQFCDD